MTKMISEKEIAGIRKCLKYKKVIYSMFLLISSLWLFAGSYNLYSINEICKKSSLTWSRVLETAFNPDMKLKYSGAEVKITHYVYKAIARYAGALFFLYLLGLIILMNRRSALILELYENKTRD